MVYNTIYDSLSCWRVKVAKGLCEWIQEDESENWVFGDFRGEKVFLGVLPNFGFLAKYSYTALKLYLCKVRKNAQNVWKCGKFTKLAIKPHKARYGLLNIFPIIHGKMAYTADHSKNVQKWENCI